MPDEQPKGKPIDQLLREHKVPTVASDPTPPPDKPQPEGMFIAADGKRYWRSEVHGETLVTPKPPAEMTEQDYYNLPTLMLDGQPGRIPQDLSVKFKDPQWAGYWFNRKARDGARVGVGVSLGFTAATKEDLESYASHLNDQDGGLVNGDLVLMKIHKAILFGKLYRKSFDEARVKGGVESYKTKAEASIHQAGGDLSKAPYYVTKQAEQEHQGLGPVKIYPQVG